VVAFSGVPWSFGASWEFAMLGFRSVVLAIVVTTIVGCGSGTPQTDSSPSTETEPTSLPTTSSDPEPMDYQVPDELCPSNFTSGLTLSTANATPDEVQLLDEVVACTNATGTQTYLKNTGDAVWNLVFPSGTTTDSFRWFEAAPAQRFREIFGSDWILLSPDSEITSNVPPASVAWEINVEFSVAWEGYGLLLEEVRSIGEAAFVRALSRGTREGSAVGWCTIALLNHTQGVGDLTNADLSEVLLDGLGTGVTDARCLQSARSVQIVPDGTQKQIALSARLKTFNKTTDLAGKVQTNLTRVSSVGSAFKWIIKILPAA
jgi:hypothetical protein